MSVIDEPARERGILSRAREELAQARRRRQRRLTPDRTEDICAQLYFEGSERRPYVIRFAVLMAASTLIATFGISTDSGPVVIGAMLVAPLMTPLLGLSGALVMGWPRRQLEQALLVLGAGVGAVVLAFLAAKTFPQPVFVIERSGELLARTAPGTQDMSIALAAGAAGAYVNVHRKAVAALPGAAIAVALIPPLAAVGISLSIGRGDLAGGAVLLFVTNLAGIVFAAALTFILTGFVARRSDGRFPRRIRRGLTVAGLVVVLVAAPLGFLTENAITQALDESTISSTTEDWLGGRDLIVERSDFEDRRIEIDLAGTDTPPPVDALAATLRGELGEDVELSVRFTRQEVQTIPAAADAATG